MQHSLSITLNVSAQVYKKLHWKKSAHHCQIIANRLKSKKVLLSVVGDLSVLEVEFVHEGLAIKEMIERFISDLKEPRAQTEKTPLQK